MFTTLPEPIRIFLDATNQPDPTLFLSAFSEDSIVRDEGKEHRGIQAIKDWSNAQHFAAQVTLEPTNIVQDGDNTIVTAKIDGNFDRTGLPDPLLLDFHFTIKNNKIVRLTILLAE